MSRQRRTVAMKVTEPLLRGLLRLPDTAEIVGAVVTQEHGIGLVTLHLDAPAAPAGSVELEPVYRRNPGDDPIELVALTWIGRDGQRTVDEVTPLADS